MMVIAPVLLLLAMISVARFALLPILDRLPAWIGWEEISGASGSLKGSMIARTTFSLLIGALPVFVYAAYGNSYEAVTISIFLVLMTSIGWIDLIDHLVPEVISIPLLALGLMFTPYAELADRLIASVIGFGIMWALMEVYSRIKNEDLISGGDIMLCAIGGAWFGLENLLVYITVSAAAFVLCAFVNLLVTDEEGFPMGPGFSVGAIAMVLVNFHQLHFF